MGYQIPRVGEVHTSDYLLWARQGSGRRDDGCMECTHGGRMRRATVGAVVDIIALVTLTAARSACEPARVVYILLPAWPLDHSGGEEGTLIPLIRHRRRPRFTERF